MEKAVAYLMEPLLTQFFLMDAICTGFIDEAQRKQIFCEMAKIFCVPMNEETQTYYEVANSAQYKNIVDYVNAQYEERIGGTATTLDAKMKELAAKNVAVDILLGRDNAKWRVVIDNFELYSAK